MTKIQYHGMPTEQAKALRDGGPDANGQKAERTISSGGGNPCRHCLQQIETGVEMLVFALRPFGSVQPYAEIGPAFLHAGECEPYAEGDTLPPVLQDSPSFIVRGYSEDERIVYGTGKVTESEAISARAQELFADPDIRFIHVRSASNNCWQARIDRS